MGAPRNEESIPSELLDDDGVFYPTNDDERMWLLSQHVRELVTRTLDPDEAERLLDVGCAADLRAHLPQDSGHAARPVPGR